MNSQLSFAVSQIHQHELRQAAREARAASRPRTRFAFPRRFQVIARTRRTASAISAHAEMA